MNTQTKGITVALANALTYTAISVLTGDLLRDGYPPLQIIGFRSIPQLIFVVLLSILLKYSLYPKNLFTDKIIAYHLFRQGLVHFLSFVCYIKLSETFSLGLATVFLFSSPVFTGVIQKLWYKEEYTVVNGLFGLLSVIGLILASLGSISSNEHKNQTTLDIIFGILYCILCPVFFSLSSIYLKRMKEGIKPNHPAIVSALFGSVFGFPWLYLFEQPKPLESIRVVEGVKLFLCGSFTAVAAMVNKIALSYISAPLVLLINTLQIVFIYICEMIMYNEYPTVNTIIGACIVIISCVASIFYAYSKKNTNITMSKEIVINESDNQDIAIISDKKEDDKDATSTVAETTDNTYIDNISYIDVVVNDTQPNNSPFNNRISPLSDSFNKVYIVDCIKV